MPPTISEILRNYAKSCGFFEDCTKRVPRACAYQNTFNTIRRFNFLAFVCDVFNARAANRTADDDGDDWRPTLCLYSWLVDELHKLCVADIGHQWRNTELVQTLQNLIVSLYRS